MSACTSDLEAISSISTPSDRSEEKRKAEELFQKGNNFIFGEGMLPNHAEGVKCYEAAAALGHPRAQALRGLCYVLGVGGPCDLVLAQECHDKAFQLGDPTAQYFKEDAHSIAPDRFGELEWVIQFVTKIAHQITLKQESDKPGILEAHWYLVTLFSRHSRVDEAKKWLREVAELGLFKAQNFGVGVVVQIIS